MFWPLIILGMPPISPLLLVGIFVEILRCVWFFLLVSYPQLVADVLSAYCPVGSGADRFLETTVEDAISKRYDVGLGGLGRVARAGGGPKGVCHGKLFSCFSK